MVALFRIVIGIGFLGFLAPLHAWNAMGHRLMAQIAYDEMTPQAKQLYQSICYRGKANSFIQASIWLDQIRSRHDPYYNEMHYIDRPFSEDGTTLPAVSNHNAVTAVEYAVRVLSSTEETTAHKREAMKILIHVVGDLHQPLHAATRVSREYPEGDKGGNEVLLSHVGFAKNLHAYWDNGAGMLVRQKHYNNRILKQFANDLEKAYPCHTTVDLNPAHWAAESHQIAVEFVYAFTPSYQKNTAYQKKAQHISQQRIALAGCRLATWMDHIAQELSI